jgi:hypothetical protein
MDELLKNNIRSIVYFKNQEELVNPKNDNMLHLMNADLQYKLRRSNDVTVEFLSTTKECDIKSKMAEEKNKTKINSITNMDSSNIFISYSHEDDEKWLNLLKKHLKVLKKGGVSIDYWDDTKIKIGDNWKEEIEKAINTAKVAILLISTNFLASDFVREEEIPKFLQNAKDKGCTIMSLIISPCRFNETKEISCFQAVNTSKKTLEDCNNADCERIFLKLMNGIESKL